MKILSSRNGFSLVELLAVVAVLAIVATATATFVRLPLRKGQSELQIAQLSDFDAIARFRSQRDGDVFLEIDCVRQTLRLHRGADVGANEEPLLKLDFEKRFMDGVFVQGEVTLQERVKIPLCRPGVSPSYAVRISTGHRDEEWLLVLGLSGQKVRVSVSADKMADVLNH